MGTRALATGIALLWVAACSGIIGTSATPGTGADASDADASLAEAMAPEAGPGEGGWLDSSLADAPTADVQAESAAQDGAPLQDAAQEACTPRTCAELHYTCGTTCDGCGHVLNCGTCTDPQVCGGGGPNVCGGNNGLGGCVPPPDAGCGYCSGPCTPITCQQLGYTCGVTGDGCGCLLDCGKCAAPEFCGGGGPNQCGLGDGGGPDACVPLSCALLGAECGSVPDGCGNTLDCGTCSGAGKCIFNFCCKPHTCADFGWSCGAMSDGCGSVLQCGTCTAPETCGGGGVQGQCGGPVDGCAP